MDLALLETTLQDLGQPRFRAGQVWSWAARGAAGYEEMTNVPAALREELAERVPFSTLTVEREALARDGTLKVLFRTHDGRAVEAVLMRYRDGRRSVCVSSQSGCPLTCTFCATGWMGYQRQLTTGEIIAQYRGAQRWALENDYGPITNIVFMGMGEPLMNPKAVFPTLSLLNGAYGVGARRITVSTVGIVPGIEAMAEMPEQYRLAVSLHAPNHELRQQLIPVEKKYPLPRLLEALRAFDAAGGKRITFEYVMIDGVNDGLAEADELAELVREFTAFVNLIPFNPIPGTDWQPTPAKRLAEFSARLERRGITARVREPRGRDIAAACGQLKAEATEGRTLIRIGESRGWESHTGS